MFINKREGRNNNKSENKNKDKNKSNNNDDSNYICKSKVLALLIFNL